MKEDNSKNKPINSNNIIKDKLNKLGIKPINYPAIDEKMKNAMNPEKINEGANSSSEKKQSDINSNNNELNRETSLNSNPNLSLNRRGKFIYLKFFS